MPGIDNINNVNNLDSKRVVSKLSFEVGEVFEAKVVEVKDQGNEVILKTSDAWQFTANAKIPLDSLPKGLVKFKVVGYEDGKLQIVIVSDKVEGTSYQEKSIQMVLKQQNLSLCKADLEILKSMVSHDIPLTKENISAVKTIIDFKEKVSANIEEEDTFISKYLQSKGVNVNSVQGKNINQLLKGFFSELKKTSIEDLVTLKENGIDITEDNLKSFNRVFKEDTGLYKKITDNINKEVLIDNVKLKDGNKGNEIVKGMEIAKGSQLAENIKSEIAQKTNFMKDVIKSMSEGGWSLIKSSINDIKVFNTVSNQYYYMDLPININQKQYECKLLIKDDRKKGKKIDSKNVKMFVSVKTINMGKVDAYIKVSDRNVSIDLKCNQNFIKDIQNDNYKLVSTLQGMNYNVNLKIEKQGYDANIVTTREFFQDNALGSINVMV